MKYDKDKISPSWEEVFEIITKKAKPVSLPKLKINRDTVANEPKTSVQRRMAIWIGDVDPLIEWQGEGALLTK